MIVAFLPHLCSNAGIRLPSRCLRLFVVWYHNSNATLPAVKRYSRGSDLHHDCPAPQDGTGILPELVHNFQTVYGRTQYSLQEEAAVMARLDLKNAMARWSFLAEVHDHKGIRHDTNRGFVTFPFAALPWMERSWKTQPAKAKFSLFSLDLHSIFFWGFAD